MSGESSEKIIVRKGAIVRCEWCGTPESYEWYTSESGEKYCSPGCLAAASESRTYRNGVVSVCCSLIILIPSFVLLMISPDANFPLEFVTLSMYAFMFLLIGIGALISSKDARKYRDRKGMFSNVSTSSLECQYCDHLNPPNVLICQNCAAPLTKAPFSQDTVPPWIEDRRGLGRISCPFCHSRYTYYGSMFNEEGNLVCQNCGKPFPYTEPMSKHLERGKL